MSVRFLVCVNSRVYNEFVVCYYSFGGNLLEKIDFCNKVVIVSGAGSGIGKACALHFAKLSAKLTLVDRNEEYVKQTKHECEELSGIQPFIVIADISKDDDVDRTSKETIKHYGKIDVLVNNAGIVQMGGVMDSITNFDKMSAINIRGTYLMIQAMLPHLIETKGNIINVSSVASTSPIPSMTGYCMTKAAVDMLTKCVALDVAPKGVRVNSVNPGPVKTEIFRRAGLDEEANKQLYAQMAMSIPLKKVVNINDVVQLVAFLASDSASSITGSTHLIDCGWNLGVPII